MLTVSDFINLIQYYYYTNSCAYDEIETIQISQLKDKYHQIWVNQQNDSIHPMTTLYEAALLMSKTRAHRIPLVIQNREIISVITQYRLLKFIANNVSYIRFFVIYNQNSNLRKKKKVQKDRCIKSATIRTSNWYLRI